MEFRTTFGITPSERKISFGDPVMFIGSCFSISIGRQFETGHLPSLTNPSGTVYNPVSVCNTLDTITGSKKFTINDLYNYKSTWLSFNHFTDFSSSDPLQVLDKINKRSEEALGFISGSRFLFITFGTARVYRWKQSGKIVSNCHKLPSTEFTHELLTVEDITSLWSDQLNRLKALFPDLKVVFTISPIRHWKDGAHENQVSKSVLFIAVEELLKHQSRPEYFPAYELVMDDLRDYRFYEEDMLHLNPSAVDYIWEAFSKCYLDEKTLDLWREVSKITKAVSHHIRTDSQDQKKKFAEKILSRIDTVCAKVPEINLDIERKYFIDLQDSSEKK